MYESHISEVASAIDFWTTFPSETSAVRIKNVLADALYVLGELHAPGRPESYATLVAACQTLVPHYMDAARTYHTFLPSTAHGWLVRFLTERPMLAAILDRPTGSTDLAVVCLIAASHVMVVGKDTAASLQALLVEWTGKALPTPLKPEHDTLVDHLYGNNVWDLYFDDEGTTLDAVKMVYTLALPLRHEMAALKDLSVVVLPTNLSE